MNNNLYTQLAPLGFAEWLEKNEWRQSIVALEDADNNFNIDSSIRTILNALAFRWLREDKDLNCEMKEMFEDMVLCKIYKGMKYICSTDYFPTHPLAEHEALNKALEILSKGGENER